MRLIALVFAACLSIAGCDSRAEQGALAGRAAPANLPTLAPMLEHAEPAVVNVSVEGERSLANNPLFQDPLFQQFFDLPQQQPLHQRIQAVGSGVIIDSAHGYIVTNNHVVRDAQRIDVTLADRRQVQATLVGADPDTDVAVLKISADHLTALPLGLSHDLHVGDYVVALGDPFGVGQTATFGVVSALGRSGLGIENYEDFIQTDAAINVGNSGGALINAAGQLVGMNTAILSASGGNVGVGFAIPVDMVRNIANELIAHGKVSRGELGVVVQSMTPLLARAMNRNVTSGALVSEVQPNSPAAHAGVVQGDVILRLNSAPVADAAQLRTQIGNLGPGAHVELVLERGGAQRTLTATLAAARASGQEASLSTMPNAQGRLAGVVTTPIPLENPNHGEAPGVYVASVAEDSNAARAGLMPGDIIMRAAGAAVSTPSQLTQIAAANSGAPLLLRVERNGAPLFLAIA